MLLASATPSLESFYKAKGGTYALVEMKKRYGEAVLPDVIITDMRKERARGNSTPYSKKLAEYLLRTKLKIAHPFVLEQESLSCLIPENCPRILYRDGDGGAGKAATLLAEWMEKGTPPPMETHRITGTEVIEKRF